MRHLLLIILLCLFTVPSTAQIAAVATATVTVAGAGGTTPAITTTGSSTMTGTLNYHTSTPPGNIADNLGSTWIQEDNCQQAPSSSGGTATYYCNPCVFGAGQTFTTTAHFAQLTVTAWSGTAMGNPIDQHLCSVGSSSGTTFSIGSITPTVLGTYCVATACNFNGTAPTSISTGYTTVAANATATAEAAITGNKALPTTATETAVVNGMTNGNPWTGAMFNLKPPAKSNNLITQ